MIPIIKFVKMCSPFISDATRMESETLTLKQLLPSTGRLSVP